MKRVISIMLCLIMILGIIPATTVFAAEETSAVKESVSVSGGLATKEEISAMKELLNDNGFGGKIVVVSPLLDADHSEKYLIAVSENGYLIAERNGFRFCECGDYNPYSEFEGKAWYYGGPFCYYVADRQKNNDTVNYCNVLNGEETKTMVTLPRNEDSKEGNLRGSTNLTAVKLKNYEEYLTKRAFGYNDDGTCSAVATAIAIGYIALNENMRLVRNEHVPEKLNGTAITGTHEQAKPKVEKAYPHAYALHRYIVEKADIDWADWNRDIRRGVENYNNLLANELPQTKSYQLELDNTILPSADTIRSEIQNNRPVLITTGYNNAGYDWHTMCVYGHRRLNGEDELLVHTGWYSSLSNWTNHKEVWIDEDYAWYGYYFSYKNPLKKYTDINKKFYEDYTFDGILYCVNKGIMAGTSETTFEPNKKLTRAMIVQILYKAAGSPSVNNLTEPFEDVSEAAYYYNAVRWAYNNHIVAGTSDTSYSPDQKLTREQLAVMLFGFAKYLNKNTSNLLAQSYFKDWNEISSWARKAMRWAGYGWDEAVLMWNGSSSARVFRPQSYATRAETAYAIYYLLEKCK